MTRTEMIEVEKMDWESLLSGPAARTSAEEAKKGFGDKANEIAKKLAGELDQFALNNFQKEVQVADPVKTPPTPQQLMMDLREAFMQVQLARGEMNKIPGMVQVYVNGAMQHLDKARDIVTKACAEVGTLKVQ